MKKFVFSLEKVLDFKQQTLEVQKNELAVLQSKLQELEREIDELNGKFAQSNREMTEAMQKGILASDIAIYKMYFDTLNRQIQKLLKEKLKIAELIVRKKADVVQTNSEISGFEKLRDKQLAEYLKRVQKIEEQAVEEFVSQARGVAI
jgi:flagellar export protein FliJ